MDGDALVCAATQRIDADPTVVVNLAARVVEHAIRAVAANQASLANQTSQAGQTPSTDE